MEKSDPRGGAEGTEERVLALHTEKLAKEIDESASVVASLALRGGAEGTEERVLAWSRRHRGACLDASHREAREGD